LYPTYLVIGEEGIGKCIVVICYYILYTCFCYKTWRKKICFKSTIFEI